MKISHKIVSQLLLLPIIFFNLGLLSHVNSQSDSVSFTTNVSITFLPDKDYVEVSHKLNINMESNTYYYPAGTESVITLYDFDINSSSTERDFKLSTLKVYRNGTEFQNYAINQNETGIEIKVTQDSKVISGSPYEFNLVYQTHELINTNGNITNLYLPGIASDYKFENYDEETGITYKNFFNTSLYIPNESYEVSHMFPENFVITDQDSYKVLSLSGNDILGKSGWVQLGLNQYSKFIYKQETPKTETLIPEEINKYTNLFSTNIYKILLPRNYDETNQKIYFTKFYPDPIKIESDSEGNLIATIEIPSNTSSEIIIEGYIEMSKSEKSMNITETLKNINIDTYISEIGSDEKYSKYLQDDIFWQIYNTTVTSTANSLKVDKTNLYELITADYKYIVDNFEYDIEKALSDNERIGAVNALNGGSSVCMEYADSLITLLRAQGIPARAAFGYGNDPLLKNEKESSKIRTITGHQWVQIWIPEYGWMSVDPTWGETNKVYIGADLDHILWYTLSSLETEIYDTVLYSANPIKGVENAPTFDLQIIPVSEEEFKSQENLIEIESYISTSSEKTNNPTLEKIDFFIKTTPLGKAIVIILPSCLVLVIFTFIFSILIKIVRKIRGKKVESK